MSAAAAGWLQVAVLVAALAVVHRPLGDYMARVFTTTKHWRVERLVYRAVGVDADSEQRWPTYVRSVLAFSLVGVLVLYLLQRVQSWLPLDNGMGAVEPGSAWNTAISFVTNTNWQGYSGESTMGHLVQMAGLAVQNFVSAATGIAVAIAVVRGFARTKTDRLGNFWVDLTRAVTRILLPISVVGAADPGARRCRAELLRGHRRADAGRRHAVPARRPGRLPGGHQGAGHKRRRLLQRQRGAPLRGPHGLGVAVPDLPDPADPLRAAAHLRPDGGGQAAGLRDPRRDGDHRRRLDRAGQLVRGPSLGHRDRAGRRGDGGQGGPLRRAAVGAVRAPRPR